MIYCCWLNSSCIQINLFYKFMETYWHRLCIELESYYFSTAVVKKWRHISDGQICLEVGEYFCYWSVAYSQKILYKTEIPFSVVKFVGRILQGSWSSSRTFCKLMAPSVKWSLFKDLRMDADLSAFTFLSLEELIWIRMEVLKQHFKKTLACLQWSDYEGLIYTEVMWNALQPCVKSS